jgi:hypothetical protein
MGSNNLRRSIFFRRAARDDLQRVIRQWPLQRLRFIPRSTQPDVALFSGRQDHRHRLCMDRPDDIVRFSRQEAVEQMPAFDRICLGAADASLQMPAKATSGRLSSIANQFGVFRGLVSAYSQKDVNGTRQRLSGASHRRQCGDPVLRMLVVMPGCCGGFGMPRRT